jgi:hypothetical protein
MRLRAAQDAYDSEAENHEKYVAPSPHRSLPKPN